MSSFASDFFPDWKIYIENSRKAWLGLQFLAYRHFDDILVVHFEELVSDLETQLRRILDFLGIYSNTSRQRLRCALGNSQGKFKRKGSQMTFDPYTHDMRAKINKTIRFFFFFFFFFVYILCKSKQ